MIKGVRIDGRLIHGQVANLWIPKLQVTRVMVVDDKTAENQIEKSGLKLAVPAGVKLSVLTAEKAAANILAGRYDSQQVLIVAKGPHYLLKLKRLGVPLDKINVGNMSKSDESISVTKSVNVLPTDVSEFKELAKDTTLTFQMVPSDKETNFMELLEKNVD